jgi:RNA polymerase sigma-70 factor (sigma-E family)
VDVNDVQAEAERPAAPDLRLVDTPTFEDVYRRHHDRMVRVAYVLTGSNEAAEDIVQDAYVQLYGRFDRLGDAAGYLYRTVVNGCRSRHRHQRVVQRFQHLFTPSPVAPSEADETWAALARLSPRRRAAVVLRYYADLPLAEVAEVLDCKIGTLKSTLHRALDELKGVVGR